MDESIWAARVVGHSDASRADEFINDRRGGGRGGLIAEVRNESRRIEEDRIARRNSALERRAAQGRDAFVPSAKRAARHFRTRVRDRAICSGSVLMPACVRR